MNALREFHRCERGEGDTHSVVVVFLALVFLFIFGDQVSSAFRFVTEHRATIGHILVAVVILLAGMFFGTQVSNNFNESWSWAQVALLGSIAYLCVTIGLPMLMAKLNQEISGALNGFSP